MGSISKLQTIQPAIAPDAPVSPNKSRNLALGIILGLMLGLGAAVLRKVLDTRIHSPNDLAEVTEAPLLGAILDDPATKDRPLTVQDKPQSPKAEAYRAMRTNLQFLDVEDGPRTYIVSSSSPGEGKTSTSINIALAFAETGSNVALLDGDMRRPRIAEYLGIEGAVGLSDVLIGRAQLGDVAQRWGRSSLYVLPSGKTPPNPSELLGSGAMKKLLATLHEHFEYVIIDSPPLLAVTDAAVVSKHGKGIILVAASGSTHKGALSNTIERIESANSELLGIVMTRVPVKGPDSYGYGEYSYSYGSNESDAGNPHRAVRHGRARRARRK